ncbi:MAG: biotin transporter BioY [Oscillospiraceae bacterium]|jgi:biotin transport system substrate-specific component|nr:biotin transporter BioY [Oscillospiraceae bacterium]
MKKNLVLNLILCALFAALSAALSQVSVPLGLVPVVMTHVAIFAGAGLLGWKWGTMSQVVYIAMGAVGLPVFAQSSGGPGVLMGPTGGFIVGYALAALGVGLLLDRFGRRWALAPAMLLGVLLVYLPGIPWLMHTTGSGFVESATLYMLPFLPGDLLKAAASAVLIARLYPVAQRYLRYGQSPVALPKST